MKNNVLVLGDGLLGSEIVKQTGWKYLSRKKDGILIDRMPMMCQGAEDIVVNCIGCTDTYSLDSEEHLKVNFDFVKKLVDICNTNETKLVHISTDYVYANSVDNATEEDVPVHLGTWYGYSKLLGEGYVQRQSTEYLICRVTHKSKPFKYSKAWLDQIGNFDYVDKQTERIIKLIKRGAKGVYNVGGKTTNMYELASKTNSNVIGVDADSGVPKNLTMNIKKMEREIESN